MTTFSFSFLPLGNLTFAYEDAYLTPGSACHRLQLRFDITAAWLDPEDFTTVVPTLISGSAWTSMPGPLRPLPGLNPLLVSARGFANQEHIYLDISDDELAAIEDASAGNDIEINLKLKAMLLRSDPTITP